MCGRFTITKGKAEIQEVLLDRFEISDLLIDFIPRYNIAPSQEILAVINDGTKNRAGFLKWGLVPIWASDEAIGNKMINAKAETLSIKPSFRDSFKNKRCLILADGFYEWKKSENKKYPVRFKMKDNSIFSFAGLWSSYNKGDGSKLYTCTIITTEPNNLVKEVHNRMPVILSPENEKIWLNPEIKDPEFLSSILRPYDEALMEHYNVSSIVNNPKTDSIECINSL